MSSDEVQQLVQDALEETFRETRELPKELGEVQKGLKVRITRLKDFAVDSLPRDSRLREVILNERDELDAAEFVAKIDVWLKLLRTEFSL
jgi:hypothetical protein